MIDDPFVCCGLQMLEPVRKKKHNAAVDPLIARITEPVLWRRLDVSLCRLT